MILNTKGNEIVRSFLGTAKCGQGRDYSIKLVSYENPVAKTEHYGEVYSAAFVEDKKGEIMWTMLFSGVLTQEEMDKQADYMIKNVSKLVDGKGEDANNKTKDNG